MATEIERKFLLANDSWRAEVKSSCEYEQGYLNQAKINSVRARVAGDKAFLSVKSATLSISRKEFEYVIPMEDARYMLDHLCEGSTIKKTRHFIPQGEHVWEIDEFYGDNAGLVVAEIELKSENETFFRPGWLGAEVSDDPRYYNVRLVDHPFKDWK